MGYLNDDDKLKALLDNGGVAPEELNPAEREPDSDVDDPSAPQQLAPPAYQPSELSSLLPPPAQQQPREELEAPPMKEAPGLPQTIVGGLLDVLINKGRGLPGIVAGLGQDDTPYENWKRKKEQFLANSGGYGRRGISDPQSLWLRQQAMLQRQKQFEASQAARIEDRKRRDRSLGQTDQRIKTADAGQALKETAQSRELDTNNPQLEASKRELYAMGARPGSLDGLDQKGVDSLKTFFAKDLETRSDSPLAQQDIQHGAASAGANSAATKQDRIDIATAAAGLQTGKEKTQNEDLAQITGWTRDPNAPEIKPAESEALRKTDAAAQQYQDALGRLREVSKSIGPADYVKAKAGFMTPAMASAMAAYSNVTTKQRVLENMGTPQAAELAMVAKQVPPPDSLSGMASGDASYGALIDEYSKNHEALMAKYGYHRGSQPQASAPAPRAPAPKRIVNANDSQWEDTGG